MVDEAYCTDESGSSRFVDILAFDPKSSKAYIIDPTIRYERNADVDSEVREEKEKIYKPCIPDLQKRYASFGKRSYEVVGLWIGARGAIGQSMIDFFTEFQLDKSILPEISTETIIASLKMIHHHIYG